MERTGLYSDDYCTYDDQTKAFDQFITNPVQVKNMIPVGDVGVPVSSSNYVKPELVNLESTLKGLGSTLSKCQPPAPKVKQKLPIGNLRVQNITSGDLTSVHTREKSDVNPVSSIDKSVFNGNPHKVVDLQQWNRIHFSGTPQRGGLHTSLLVRDNWFKEKCFPSNR